MAGADYGRIRDPELTEHVVYRLLNRRGRTLYIGCTMNLKSRVAEHRRNKLLGHLIADVVTIGPLSYQEARRVEALLTLTEKPEFNSEHKPRTYVSRGRKVSASPRRMPS